MFARKLYISFLFLVWGILGLNAQSLYFSPNEGQWIEPVLAKTVFKGGAFFLRKDGFRIRLVAPEDAHKIHQAFHFRHKDTTFSVKQHVVDVRFLNCNLNSSAIETSGEADYYENYYLGDDISRWRTGVYPVNRIKVKNVYAGIDFVIYTRGEQVEFDWIVNPGGNPANIQALISGQTEYEFANQELHIQTTCGSVIFRKPMAYQGEKTIPCNFDLKGDTLGFDVKNWNKNLPLVIDPILVFSTYSGSRGDNFGFTATYDSTGHLYAGGIVDNSQGIYPVTTGAFQTVYGGSGPQVAPVYLPCDVAISKYLPNGSALAYATYLGGRSNEYPHSLSIDEKNNLLVLGTTSSNDFPVLKQTAFDSAYNGNHDLYVVKLSADGKKMLGGTYVGGSGDDGINTGTLHFNYADDFRGDILADKQGNIYVASCTKSGNFPLFKAAQQIKQSTQDAAIFSLNGNLSSLRWSTFLGGNADDAAYSIKLDDSMHLFVGGGTSSPNFPVNGKVFGKAYAGGTADGFIARLNADTGSIFRSGYWGTSNYDQIYFLDFDPAQNIYMSGQTKGTVTRSPGTYGKNGTTQFIGKISNSLDTLKLITTFGNRTATPELSPCAFMVDRCYNIYFSGWGCEIGVGNAGTTAGLEITPNAYQKITDNNDFYLIVLSQDAGSLIYSTYFGGDESEDHVDGGTSRFDKRGVIYQSVCASCPSSPPGLNDFPTTAGSVFPTNLSYRCSNASFKFDFNITYAIEAKFDAVPRRVCMPQPINFINKSPGLRSSYFWDFGDGNTSVVKDPVHIYTKPGKYTVKFRVLDTASCNKTDSMTLEVEVLEGPVGEIAFEIIPCTGKVNLELTGSGFSNPKWDLGDGDTFTGTKLTHSYASGKYNLKVFLVNPVSGCRDTAKKILQVNSDSSGEVKLANVFTPNTDGYNDCYKVVGLSPGCDEAVLKIFNRWGERIYYSTDVLGCWNGRVDNTGPELPAGTYFYQIVIKRKINSKDEVVTGSINLIRD